MDEYNEISGVRMGQIVDYYIKDRDENMDGMDRDEWRKCYRFMMRVIAPTARISNATKGRKPRYIEEWVTRELPVTYDKWLWKQAQKGRED